MKKLIILTMFILLLAPMMSAQSSFIFKVGEDIDLKIPVFLSDNTPALSSTTCALTVTFPNASIFIDDEPMTFNQGFYNFTVNGTRTVNGIYPSSMSCTNVADSGFTTFTFEVTPTGTNLSVSGGILYVVIIVISIVLLLLVIWGFVVTPYKNERSAQGDIINLNFFKHLKVMLFFASYIMLVWISFLMWGVARNFLILGVAENIFRALFFALATALFPIGLVLLIVILLNYLNDKKIQKALVRGIPMR